jgi:hypothetical protein
MRIETLLAQENNMLTRIKPLYKRFYSTHTVASF